MIKFIQTSREIDKLSVGQIVFTYGGLFQCIQNITNETISLYPLYKDRDSAGIVKVPIAWITGGLIRINPDLTEASKDEIIKLVNQHLNEFGELGIVSCEHLFYLSNNERIYIFPEKDYHILATTQYKHYTVYVVEHSRTFNTESFCKEIGAKPASYLQTYTFLGEENNLTVVLVPEELFWR